MKQTGILAVSLDFELYWGVADRLSLDSYRQNLLGVRTAIPAMLEMFQEYGIHATWAVVGFLFCKSKQQLWKSIPAVIPGYDNPDLSPYLQLGRVGSNETEDPYHYAPSLLRLILSYPNQRIGSHTLSHYYCLESGQSREAFRVDLLAARTLAFEQNIRLESLVFPRNQVNPDYLSVCAELGIKSFRGNPRSWIYRAAPQQEESVWKRGLRLLDAYLNLTGHNGWPLEDTQSQFPRNVPASRFLRPYARRLKLLEPLKLRRIRSDLTYAASRGLLYHLWWHPHNFGANLRENLNNLQGILEHYRMLRNRYGMQSLNMEEIAALESNPPAERILA